MVQASSIPIILRWTPGGDDGDRLSNLPEAIVDYIFSFLETIDAVRASAVSRKWRYLRVSIPYLKFNIHTVWSNPEERWSLQTINKKFKDFVNWALLSQNGSITIQRFRLWRLNYAYDYTLYRWISAMARRNAQVLDLNIDSDSPIELPHCLVTCQSLVELKLDFGAFGFQHEPWVLKLPTSAGFSQLKSFVLKRVELLDYILFHKFIISCPLLDKLNMKACIFRNFKILDLSASSLKDLTIDDATKGEPKGLRNCEVKVASPNLLSLKFMGLAALEFSFQGLISLQNAFIYLEFAGHEKAEEIYFRCEDMDFWEIPEKAIPCLTYHLKTVELFDFDGNENELEMVRFLLMNGLVLQKMSISWVKAFVKNSWKIITQVMEFPMLSPIVALTFLQLKVDWFDVFEC